MHKLDIPALIARLNQLGRRYLEEAHRPGRKQQSPEFFRFHCCCGWRNGWFHLEAEARAALERHLDRAELAA